MLEWCSTPGRLAGHRVEAAHGVAVYAIADDPEEDLDRTMLREHLREEAAGLCGHVVLGVEVDCGVRAARDVPGVAARLDARVRPEVRGAMAGVALARDRSARKLPLSAWIVLHVDGGLLVAADVASERPGVPQVCIVETDVARRVAVGEVTLLGTDALVVVMVGALEWLARQPSGDALATLARARAESPLPVIVGRVRSVRGPGPAPTPPRS